MNTNVLVLVIFVPVLAYVVYRRLRGNIGRQRFAPRRLVARVIALCVIGIVLVASFRSLEGLAAAIAGATVGVALSAYAIAHTKFENTDAGLFYTPNRWTGLCVTSLFLARLAWRLLYAFRRAQEAVLSGEPLGGLHRSPLTLSFYFLLAGYYVAYYTLLLRRAPLISSPTRVPPAT